MHTRLISLFLGLLATALMTLGLPAVAQANSAVVRTDQVRAELLIHAPQGLQPGREAWLGLKIEHRPGWHTYWLNPGDSGLPTSLQWQLPAGLVAGDIEWPVPERLPIGPLMNHGYEGTLLLPVPLRVEQAPGGGALALRLRADWLVCKDVCIPEGGDFTLALPSGAAASALVGARDLFDQAQSRRPVMPAGLSGQAEVTPDGLSLAVTGLPAAWQGRRLAVFPETPYILAPAAEPVARWEDGAPGRWSARLAYAPQRLETPTTMAFVLSTADGPPPPGGPQGVRLNATVQGDWSRALPATEAAPAAAFSPSSDPSSATGGSGVPSLGLALLLALVGGAILNLMPCVFPVLSLKAFGFAQHAQDRRALALGGLAYTVGVVASFAALAGLLLALRASGEQLGWGFQLQSPLFVAALALLFTLMGLNLLGLFEFRLSLPGRWAGAQARHPVVDQALTGVLAVVVASPCTAPFMGASLGAAVTMPTAQALTVFIALGLGMALPYLLLCLLPQLARRLPRPGPWMLHFKQAMALPMLATVIWLLWVLGHQAGVDAVVGLLGVLLMLAFAIGAWQVRTASAAAGHLLRGVATLGLVASLTWAWPALKEASAPAPGLPSTAEGTAAAIGAPGPSTAIAPGAAGDGMWAPWSRAALAQAHAAGRTVFVDFTAAWCVTCQVNKRSTLRDARVLQALAERDVVAMRADWTRRDAAISEELGRLQRTGVPVYVVYPPGQPPVVLPELLTPQIVIDAVSALPRR